MGPLFSPLPQNPIQEHFLWRDFFRKIAEFKFGTASTVDLPLTPTQGGTGITSYATGDVLHATAPNVLGKVTGISVVITTAPLTGIGTPGSMTFTHGILTAQTPAT